jgi:hypothetical protein
MPVLARQRLSDRKIERPWILGSLLLCPLELGEDSLIGSAELLPQGQSNAILGVHDFPEQRTAEGCTG